MSRTRILDPFESYTFRNYAELADDSADILAEFGVTLNNSSLQLPQQLPIDLNLVLFVLFGISLS